MSPLFLVKILCYRCRPFITTLASSEFICAGSCQFRIKQQSAKINAEDASVTVKCQQV